MLELSTLNFAVDTTKLREAHDLIQGLVPAMQGVANASGKMAKDTTQAAKATEEVGKSAERTGKRLSVVERAAERQSLKNKILRGEVIQLVDAQVQLDKVFTSGQAAQLASLKLAGATADQYGKMASEMRDYNQMVGANKFDDSVNGLTKLRKEVQELTLVQKLQADGYQLSAKEIRDLARDEEVLKQSKERGQLTEGQYAAKIAETRQEYIRLSAEKAKFIQQSKLAEEQIKREAQAQARSAAMVGEDAVRLFRENEAAKKAAAQAIAEAEAKKQAAIQRTLDLAKNAGRTLAMIGRSGQMYSPGGGGGDVPKPPTEQPMDKAMALFYKEQERNAKAAARANQFLATEMQRLDSILAELNREHTDGSMLSERHAASIARFSNQLKMAGVSGTQATAQLEGYRQKMQQIEALENRRAQNRLANALAPQISDVAVSLAGGMPLHLVIMQQGLQIRDLIGQSGVAAEHLQKTMREAMKNMVTSIGGTVAALAQMTAGALMDAGRGIAGFGMKASGATAMLDRFAAKNTEVAAGINIFRSTIAGIMGVFTGGLIVGLGMLTYEYIKLIGANNDLARSLAVTGNVFGVTYGSSISYVEGLTKVGASTRDAMEIIREMSKTSHLTVKDLDMVGTAAIRMQDYAGVAIEDTIKAFNDMAKDPVKALTELAIKTGDVAPEVTKLARELVEQGRVADATGIAMRALADQQKVAVDRMIADLHPLTKAWIDFKKFFGELYAEMGVAIQRATSSLPERQKIQDQIKDNLAVLPIFRTKAQDEELKQLQQRLVMLDKVEQSEVDRAQTRSKAEKEAQKAAELSLQYTDKAAQKNKALAQLEKDRAFLIKQGSPMSEAAYNEQLKKIEDQFKDKDVGKAAAAAARYEKSAIEKLNDAYNKTVSKARELSDIEKAMLDIRDDPDYLKRSAAGRKELEDRAVQLHRQAEAELRSNEAAKKYADDLAKSYEKLSSMQQQWAQDTMLGSNYYKELEVIENAWFDGAISNFEEYIRLQNEAFGRSDYMKRFGQSGEAFNQTMQGLSGQSRDLDFERSLIGKSEKEIAALRLVEQERKAIEQSGTEFTKKAAEAQKLYRGEQLQTELERLGTIYQAEVELHQKTLLLEKEKQDYQQSRLKAYDAVLQSTFSQMGDALIDFAITGKSSFGDMIQSMLVDLAKLEMRMQMMKWYESMGGGTGGGGILSGLLGMFTGTTQAKGGAWSNGVQMFAKGGVVNRTTAFGMRGGLGIMGEAGPEAIMPLKRGRDGSLGVASAGGSNVQVVVNNYSGAQVKQQETVDSRGNRKVEVVVGEMASGEVQRSGSAMQRGIGSTFGMRPALIAR